MLRSVLLACAGVIAAACVACAPPPPPKAGLAVCRDGSRFLDHVKFIPNGFIPVGTNPWISPLPPPHGIGVAIGPDSIYAEGLQDAFLLAPDAFRDRLCGLTGIYVNGPTGCGKLNACIGDSWGYRAWTDNSTYIAVTAGLWRLACPDGSAYVYHCFATDLDNAVLKIDPSAPGGLRYGPANAEADNFAMTILAALVHEVGHVRWYQVMSPNRPANSSAGPTYNPNGFCNGHFFGVSWVTPVHAPPPWRSFGQPGQDRHLGSPDDINDTIRAYVRRHDIAGAGPWLAMLYRQNQPWPSYFSSISPDEDFVETYKFVVLTNAQGNVLPGEGPLTSLPVEINGKIIANIPEEFGKNLKVGLRDKTDCFAKLI